MTRIRRITREKTNARDRGLYAFLFVTLSIGLLVALVMPALGYNGPDWFTQGQAFLGLGIATAVMAGALVILLARHMVLERRITQMEVVREETLPTPAKPAKVVKPARPAADAVSSKDGTPLVTEVEGIGRTYGARLNRIGIHTTDELRRAKPRVVARRIAVEPMLVREWQAMARLMRVEGIGPQYAELLVLSGIRSPRALAQANANALRHRLEEVDARHDVTRRERPVSHRRVDNWIASARRQVA